MVEYAASGAAFLHLLFGMRNEVVLYVTNTQMEITKSTDWLNYAELRKQMNHGIYGTNIDQKDCKR